MFNYVLASQQLDFRSWCLSWGWCSIDDVQRGARGPRSQLGTYMRTVHELEPATTLEALFETSAEVDID